MATPATELQLPPPKDTSGVLNEAHCSPRNLAREIEDDFQASLGELLRQRRVSAYYGLVKRSLDVTIAAGLLVLLSPLLLLVAAAIRLESQGPVFFVQERRGLLFKRFRMWKFRSMAAGAPDPTARYETQSTDPRITRVGRLLRKTSIDELPQLFNVLVGEMSLVGPRPLVEWESCEASKTHGERYLVLPGITGLSQVTVRNSADFLTRLDKDAEYVQRQSLGLDLWIILRTPWQVFVAKMIYPDDR